MRWFLALLAIYLLWCLLQAFQVIPAWGVQFNILVRLKRASHGG